jgi:hypothetical protein
MTQKSSCSSRAEYGAHFEHHLEEFRQEIEGGTQFFYAMLAINAVAATDAEVLDRLNSAPLFWKTNMAALQTATFVILGRVFDQKSTYNIDALVRLAQSNITLFSKEALGERKRTLSSNADEWLAHYLTDVYEPSHDDFRCLRRYVRKYRKIYESTYDEIRDRIYAHKEVAPREARSLLFSRTRVLEIQRIFNFLNQTHRALWELYFNGSAPRIRRMPYSVTWMLREEKPSCSGRAVQQTIIDEIRNFLLGTL